MKDDLDIPRAIVGVGFDADSEVGSDYADDDVTDNGDDVTVDSDVNKAVNGVNGVNGHNGVSKCNGTTNGTHEDKG